MAGLTPEAPHATVPPRRAVSPPLGAVLLAALALLGLVLALPLTGRALPGTRRLQAAVAGIPWPWKPPRPMYVAPPESMPEAVGTSPVVTAGEPAAATGPPPTTESVAPAQAAGAPEAPASLPPVPPTVRLDGIRHQWQTWNNCGPATITMATSYFGRPEGQAQAAPLLKPNANDKNVGPDELVAYARSLGLESTWRAGGDRDRLKLLLAHGVPVIVSIWITPAPNDGLGHYRLLVGYDDAAGRFAAYDSFVAPGANLPVPYDQLDAEWRPYNRTYTVVYRPEQAPVVERILGPDRDDRGMYERALSVAQAEAAAAPDDAFAWFNLGTNLVALGRTADAVPAFDRARALRLPWRFLWYQFGPFEAYLAEGRPGDVVALTGANLAQAADLEEAHYYRGRALQAQGQLPAARAAYQAAQRLNPRFGPAAEALARLG